MSQVHGHCALGFEQVAEEFAEIIAADAGAGSAFTAFRGSETVVDLRGGFRDPDTLASLTDQTLLPVFSGTKGIVATAACMLIDRGALDPDAPVATYWPEFAAEGKQDIKVADVLAHAVGLPYPEREVSLEMSGDAQLMAEIMAGQSPLWPVGTRIAYHALSYGWLVSEIVCRVDGRTIDEFVRAEITERLPVDVWIGLPESEWSRTGKCWRSQGYSVRRRIDTPESRAHVERVYGNPPVLTGNGTPWNTEHWWRVGSPGGGAMASAHGMAALYSAVVSGALVGPTTTARAGRERSRGADPGTGRPLVFGLGYELQDELQTYGPARVAFGHSGAGGSVHGCWPDLGVSFSFTPCMMRTEGEDVRSYRLLSALHACLDAD